MTRMGCQAAAQEGPKWKVAWRTEEGDHGGHPVSALAYAPRLPGLPGGDGHAGWLIAASRQLLNLWECSASGGRGEPSLQVTLGHLNLHHALGCLPCTMPPCAAVTVCGRCSWAAASWLAVPLP